MNSHKVMLMTVLCFALGCQQKMAEQPSYKPLRTCEFFADGRSERPMVSGTVARGHLDADVGLFTGRRVGKSGEPLGMKMPAVVQPPPGSPAEIKAQKSNMPTSSTDSPFP